MSRAREQTKSSACVARGQILTSRQKENMVTAITADQRRAARSLLRPVALLKGASHFTIVKYMTEAVIAEHMTETRFTRNAGLPVWFVIQSIFGTKQNRIRSNSPHGMILIKMAPSIVNNG